jgi:hypothetical protein
MGRPMKPLMALLATILFALGASPSDVRAEKETRDCTDHCADRASRYCEDLESWKCNVYIWGCLAGCNVNKIG